MLSNSKGEQINSTHFYELINSTVFSSGSFLSESTVGALQSLPLWFNSSGYPVLNVTAFTGTPGNASFLMVRDIRVTLNAAPRLNQSSKELSCVTEMLSLS